MFYRPGIDPHGLSHNPFKAMVAPRPIGWISSLDAKGTANLAPYSYFNVIADNPPMVMISSTGAKPDRGDTKDTVANIRETGEFVCNIVSFALKDAMNQSSGDYPADVDEFEIAGLEKAPCEVVKAPRVAAAPGALECKLWKVIDLPAPGQLMVIGEVVGIHIDDAALKDGIFDVTSFQPVSRLGYLDYSYVSEVFQMNRPKV